MMNGQSYAVEIEHIIRDVFSCDRFGFGGVANSDFIRSKPFIAIIAALAYQFAVAGENQRGQIENFIEDKSFYSDFSIDELLSFETSEKVIDGINVDIGFLSGGEAIKKLSRILEKLLSDKEKTRI
ncbi:hypothetical protein SAMN00017405_0519 [Desulfonispora thiosulfatigenes DSM 11270]|uniref:Uncharacterized protein n=1 Tax=Desulfonispora thiosulfatigenes DSM 11270 TaxID=656914 RepID=A0A1W1V5N5_DESTI|nr:hypothetical protein [Desulfonispora thiosulfatigenes]SMB88747.1 hypothetical protein SAMN00017405_0519 [Desulfonispora thiosulfatigenes DSM 11270]